VFVRALSLWERVAEGQVRVHEHSPFKELDFVLASTAKRCSEFSQVWSATRDTPGKCQTTPWKCSSSPFETRQSCCLKLLIRPPFS
jgi:hypothetical protein